MPLKCGIVGLSLVGKTTIFNCFSNARAHTGGGIKANIGTIHVPDPRLYEIDKLIKSAKIVPATVEIVDIPGLAKGGGQESGGNKFLADIQQTDAIIHVLRCFDDDTVPHIEGSVDPVRDREIVDLELQIRDLDMVERKIQRVEKIAKSGEREPKHILDILHKLKDHLENFQNARTFNVSEEDKKHILADMYLLTAKPVLYVCNVDDASAATGNAYVEAFRKSMAGENAEITVVAGKLEAEIAELEEEEDRKAFLADAGLQEPGVNRLVRTAYHLLNLQSFFTAGPKEVRAWTIHKGETAQQAAGVIHSDLERGFIRAEVMKYNDFIQHGSEHALKEIGKLHVEGKSYIVEDGDIMHIRFNV